MLYLNESEASDCMVRKQSGQMSHFLQIIGMVLIKKKFVPGGRGEDVKHNIYQKSIDKMKTQLFNAFYSYICLCFSTVIENQSAPSIIYLNLKFVFEL